MLCRCGCGLSPRRGNLFINGHNARTHGHTRRKNQHPLYSVWTDMIRRCGNSNAAQFPRYGGRGIKVCARWRASFAAFLEDMGDRPTATSIERRDNDGDYEPGNCRWATRLEQQQNTSRTRRVQAFGRSQSLSAWAREFGLGKWTLRARLVAGVHPEIALSTPIKNMRA